VLSSPTSSWRGHPQRCEHTTSNRCPATSPEEFDDKQACITPTCSSHTTVACIHRHCASLETKQHLHIWHMIHRRAYLRCFFGGAPRLVAPLRFWPRSPVSMSFTCSSRSLSDRRASSSSSSQSLPSSSSESSLPSLCTGLDRGQLCMLAMRRAGVLQCLEEHACTASAAHDSTEQHCTYRS
jgi:hypothetical protein